MAIWTKSLTTFEANCAGIYSLCQFGSKVYAGTYYNGINTNNYAQIWESTDGLTWTKNATFPTSGGIDTAITGPANSGVGGDVISGMVVFGSKLYILRAWAGQPRIYSTTDGTTWVLEKVLYASNSLTYSRNLMTDGSKLYVAGGSGNARVLTSASTPSGTWTSELTATNLYTGTISIKYGSDIFLTGSPSTGTDDAWVYRKTSGTWNSGTKFTGTKEIYDACVFKNKLYLVGSDTANLTTQTKIHCWDGTSWTTTTQSATFPSGPTIFVSTDNYLYANAANTSPGGITTYNFYRSADGSTFSTTEAVGNAAAGLWSQPRSHTNFDRRSLIGVIGTGGSTGGIYYSGQLVGACVGNSSWNESDAVFALSNGPC